MVAIVQFKEVKALTNKYLSKTENEELKRAYQYAKKAHKDQKRKSGEDYIHHPLAVTKHLALLKTSLNTLIAGLLHDVVEDCSYTLEDIKKDFNKDIAKLVDGVTKIGDLTNTNKNQLSMLNIKKIMFSGVSDVRILIIKLCDRLHNVRTLSAMPEDKRKRIAKETLEIYCPIALKLSLFDLKMGLEQEAFQWAYPEENNLINEKLEITSQNAEKFLENIKENIKKLTKKAQIKVAIEYRIKTNYSIYRKLYIKGRRWEKIMDIIAVRLVVHSIDDCYKLFGLVCQKYKPVLRTYKDYISIPKDNGYQAIHIVLTYNNFVFETQIKTEAMNIQANTGNASTLSYKTNLDKNTGKFKEELTSKNQWFTDIKNLRSENEIEFIEDLYSHIASRNIYTITPTSDVIILPKGSTALDFAYKVHSYLGNHFKKAVANGQEVGYNYELRNGSSVKIITSDKIQVRQIWLTAVKTKTATSSIKSALSKVEKNFKKYFETIGKKIISQFLTLDTIAKLNYEMIGDYFELDIKGIKDFYEAIGREIIPASKFSSLLRISNTKGLSSDKRALDITLDNSSINNLKIAKCCKPIPGDHIIGLRKNNDVKVHMQNCRHIPQISRGNTINASWTDTGNDRSYKAKIEIVYNKDNLQAVNIISGKIISIKVAITEIRTIPDEKSNYTRLVVTLLVKNSIELDQIIRIIGSLAFVNFVNRLTS